ncbi:DUF3298 domain-containing protein [Aquimarina algicola]|uniref:DUF3298 domain-containing protein n=1 Tax=Aquimarina algicola TaxID=2589995 RepID=A0A504JIP7_9FLAO|nr:DUF3298 domain-containing protein [Aquimarina algicola]TPN87493.1 DUF3298 domain-containing protein [Aquimarina algicola]
MKPLIYCLSLLFVFACNEKSKEPSETQNRPTEQPITTIQQDTLPVFSEIELIKEQEKTKAIKKQKLLAAEDDKTQLQELLISKSFFKDEDQYTLEYRYPFLNENIDPNYATFNKYIKENYLDIEKTENEILEDKELICDTLKINRLKDKRSIDYKVYDIKNNLISVVLYKENYYSGMRYSTYLFDCINFSLDKHDFVYFNDFFEDGSEKEMFNIINKIIKENIQSGEMYYDCWELSEGDFKAYKNNFVVNHENVEFYFDDCVICPSYTGTYSIIIPVKEILHLVKKFNNTPIIS